MRPPRRCTRLYQQGKIRAIGVSNYSVPQMERFRSVAPLHVLQPPYNLFERAIESDVLPYCRKNNISTLGYGALCRGLLSGKMRPDTTFTGDDLRKTDPKFQQPRFAQYLAAVQRLDQLAQDHYRKRVIHLAVRWLLDQGVTVGVVGRTSSWAATAGGRCDWLVARRFRHGRDRPHPARDDHRSRRPRVHGSTGAQ